MKPKQSFLHLTGIESGGLIGSVNGMKMPMWYNLVGIIPAATGLEFGNGRVNFWIKKQGK